MARIAADYDQESFDRLMQSLRQFRIKVAVPAQASRSRALVAQVLLTQAVLSAMLALASAAAAQVGYDLGDGREVRDTAPPAAPPPAPLQASQPGAAPAPAPAGAPPPVAPMGAVPLPAPPPNANAQQPLSASAQADVGLGGASASTDVGGGGEWPPETREQQLLRITNTWFGPTGGVHILDAGSGIPGTFRLQMAVDFFAESDFLLAGDGNDYAGGTLSFSWTPLDHLELYAALENHANANDSDEPRLMQVLGDTNVGVKAYGNALPWLALGGDVRVLVLNTVGDVGPVLDALSLGLRLNASADLRQLEEPVPLIMRFNLDYLLDNSSNLIEGVEAGRYERLGADRADIDSEVRHLLRRVERFALGINRTDMLTFGLGLEAPLRAGERWFLHPLLEWSFGVPVNRQGYSCLLVDTTAGPEDADGCLDIEGSAAMPSMLTVGVRLHPPVNGLSFLAGLDVGLSGTSTFVRELAPTRPWALLLGISYAIDTRERAAAGPPQVQLVRIPAPPVPPKPRVHGIVVDAMSGAPIAGATVRYPIATLNPQLTDAAGQFISYELEPGPLSLDVSAPDYDPRVCSVDVPAPSSSPAGAAGPNAMPEPVSPVPPGNAPIPLTAPRAENDPEQPSLGGAPALNPYFGSQGGPSAAGASVSMRCELTPRPRVGAVQGRVVDAEGKPVAGASAQLTGANSVSMVSDAMGEMNDPKVPAGDYQLRVEAEGFLLRQLSVKVVPGQTTNVEVALVPKPKEAQVELTQEEVRIRKQVFFKTNSAEIVSERSNDLLSEVADVLLRNPQVTQVEVQGHTDNKGAPELNRELSQARAEAVRAWLLNAGIAADRLTAIGYGDSRPLAPNLTERARARNRRVQFIIRQQQ
jgi:outer membrane protein OmpA-like peptidoglycan-associated protein